MRAELLVLLAGAIAAVSAWARIRYDRDQNDAPSGVRKHKNKKKPKPEALAYRRDMNESEYTKLIPKQEMQQLQALLDSVYATRGWGSNHAMCMAAWEAALVRAMSDADGAWEPHLPAASLQPDHLQQLVNLLDEVFLGGQLQTWLVQQGKTPMRVQPITYSIGPDNWYANFFPQQNTVAIKRLKWAEDNMVVTPQQPADYEGVHCTCRLQVLMHTLAHEMVHALVYHRLPDMDTSSTAYLIDDRHGPIFRLLSVKLFGHKTEEFKRSRARS